MNFKDFMMKVRRTMLCCGAEEKRYPLEISSPTDVRKVCVLDVPGLTEEQRATILEKAALDAARLLSLSSHPPTRPPSITPSSVPSQTSSRSPSVTLLNSASANLPTALPTPPRQKHNDTAPPSSAHRRMKGFWERTRRISNPLSMHSHNGYHDLKQDGTDADEGVVLLSLDNMDFKELDLDSPISGKSQLEGFEAQDVIGGRQEVVPINVNEEKKTKEQAMNKEIQVTGSGPSSNASDDEDGEGAAFGNTERKPLVKAM